MSRGAAKAVFVELDRKAVGIIRQNLKHVELADLADVYAVDALRALKLLNRQQLKFDIIYLGAPYDSPALEKVIAKISEADLLRESGIVIAEHRKQHQIQEKYGKLKTFREAKYGETILTFYENSNLPG